MVAVRTFGRNLPWLLALAACGRVRFDTVASGGGGDSSVVDARVTYPQAVLADGPVAYWRLGEPSGTIAHDASGHGVDGTYQGGFTLGATGAIAGDPDTAVTLGGTNGFVRIPNVPTIDNVAIVTIEAWARGASTSMTQLFSAAGGGGYQVVWNGGVAGAYARGIYVNATTRITDAAWHQIVVTWDGAAATVYLDGVTSNMGASTILPNSLENQIGAQCVGVASTGCSLYMVGSVDEVSIYDQVLPATRVQAHYAAAIGM
jgi:hypothetical protein